MNNMFELRADLRNNFGKGASRRLRRNGKIPAIIYGEGINPQPLVLSHLEVLNRLKNEAFYSHLLTIDFGNRKESVVLRALQRHPFKQTILHMDFLRVSADHKLSVHVPLHLINEEIAPGIKHHGGVISRTLINIEVSCLPKDLPEFIEIDLTNLRIGEAVHLTQIKLPAGVELSGHIVPGSEQDTIIVSIQHPNSVEVVPNEALPTVQQELSS
jgi:large subunit ribosomal protein L25